MYQLYFQNSVGEPDTVTMLLFYNDCVGQSGNHHICLQIMVPNTIAQAQ